MKTPDDSGSGRISRVFLVLVFCDLLLPAPILAGAPQATVQAERTTVYAKPRARDDAAVKTLKRGDAVEVGMSVSSGDGDWCEVSDPSDHRALGYVRCGDIKRREQAGPAPEYVSAPAEAEPQARRPAPAGAAVRTVPNPSGVPFDAGWRYVRILQFWSGQFEFTPEQQGALRSLADARGMTACRQQIEAYARNYARELTEPPPGRPDPEYQRRLESMKTDLNRFWYPCEMRRVEVLERLPGLMTAEQRNSKARLLETFQKEVATLRKTLTSPDLYRGVR